MKVFMIGGTGLLGSEAARLLIEKGHEVSSVSLPPIPSGENLPKEMKLALANYMELSDLEIKELMKDCEGFIFAAGVDERIEGTKPIYDFYAKYNIIPLERMMKIAKEVGVKHVVVLGSYFSYFDREWKELNLYNHHPYIRSRVDQANMALSYASKKMSVSVLELPYIFGTQPGRKPVWTFLIEQIQLMKKATFYPRGGTTMVTVRHVAECICGVLEKGNGGKNYPIGYYNLTWKEMLTIFHEYMGTPKKKIITIPKFLYKIGMKRKVKEFKEKNIESGLNLMKLVDIMTRNAFIDKTFIVDAFDVRPDDIHKAIGQSVSASLSFLNGTENFVDMKGE